MKSRVKRKVVFVHGSLGMGGAEVLRMSVLEELMQQDDLEVRVCVLRDRGVLADRVTELGVPLDVLGSRGGLFDILGVVRLARYLSKHRPQIAQASQFLTNLHTRLAGWIARTPIVIIEEHGIYTWKKWYHKLIDRWINSRADGVVACSRRVAESAAANLKILTEQVSVIHNCASRLHFAESDSDGALRKQLGSPSFVVCVVGTLRWEKGHRYLLEAWKTLESEEALPIESQLWIVGNGPLESNLRQLAGESKSVRFLGRRDDTRSILWDADLFVLPSVNEGFGIAIVEAMCAGLPVISTRSGGIPEVIDHDRTGVLVEPEDAEALAEAMRDLIKDCERRGRLGAAARREASDRFTPARYAEQLVQLWDELSDGRFADRVESAKEDSA